MCAKDLAYFLSELYWKELLKELIEDLRERLFKLREVYGNNQKQVHLLKRQD
jgi:hypothetical protein